MNAENNSPSSVSGQMSRGQASKTITCVITSIREEIFRGQVQGVVATGSAGELGILPGHAPLLTELVPGPIQLQNEQGEEDIFYIKGGFLEVQPDCIHILADDVLRQQAMSEEAAEQARQEAESQLEAKDQMGAKEYAAARAQMIESIAQIRTLRRIQQKYGK